MPQRRTLDSGFRLTLTLALALALSGCGVLIGGTTKTISVGSDPTSARLTTEPLTGSYTTPTVLELERKKSYTLVLWKEGYQETQFPIQRKIRPLVLVADILMTALVFPIVVDAVTGGWWDLRPEVVTVTVEPLDESSGLAPITVTISTAESAGGSVSLHTTEAVGVRVEGR